MVYTLPREITCSLCYQLVYLLPRPFKARRATAAAAAADSQKFPASGSYGHFVTFPAMLWPAFSWSILIGKELVNSFLDSSTTPPMAFYLQQLPRRCSSSTLFIPDGDAPHCIRVLMNSINARCAKKRFQEAKLEGQRRKLKRYQDYLTGSTSSTDPEEDEVNDLLNR